MTRAQVAAIKHLTLIIYKNEVFDVSNFVDAHPGGPQYLLVYAGRDCSIEFDQAGHSEYAQKQMRHFKIGDIEHDDLEEVEELEKWTHEVTLIQKN
jgi:cytochrome b involved in lipid metabolism